MSRLISEQSDSVLVLTLNRPEKRNAIDNDIAQALLHTRDAAAEDERVCAVLLHGQGTAFCAGSDVSADPTEEDLVLVQGVAQAIVTLPKPVVAQVHGWTVGAGL